MISVSHLTKRYGTHLAVDDLSFEVGKGEVVGFLGPNGAGKSTTLRVLAGFAGMTSGAVTIDGRDIETDSFEARKRIGYMPEAVPLYGEMRVGEYLAFRAELKGVPRGKRRARVALAMEKSKVEDREMTLIGNLSKGYKQRVGLADALVADPPLLILDEPTAGLDPNQIREVREVIKGLGSDHTVLLSTHILSEVESSCGRVLVINRGRLVAEGSVAKIKSLQRSPGIEVRVRGDGTLALAVITKDADVSRVDVERVDGEALLRCTWSKKSLDAPAASERIIASLVGAGAGVRAVAAVSSSLEEVFAELTRDGAAPEISPIGDPEGAAEDA
jgi:ABC-2 type transport system ATP-binding protein